MVDYVTLKMPSENDVHVARSFLTKILRSSMRYGVGFMKMTSPVPFPNAKRHAFVSNAF